MHTASLPRRAQTKGHKKAAAYLPKEINSGMPAIRRKAIKKQRKSSLLTGLAIA